MKRHLFRIVALVSLLLFVALTALYVRSYWAADEIERFDQRVLSSGDGQQWTMALYSARGHIGWTEYRYIRPPIFMSPKPSARWSHQSGPPTWPGNTGDWMNRRGFGFGGERKIQSATSTTDWRYVWMPTWFPLLLTALLPAAWLIHWHRRGRFGPGQCRKCGYDLRATPDRCPECGAAAEAAA